jgi:hypothetical protein
MADVMQTVVDKKYINMVSASLEKFKWKKDNMAACRCFKCGDSQKNKTKTRGYFYVNKDQYYYKCHNCGFCCTVKTVLENLSPQLAKEYSLETYKMNIGRNMFMTADVVVKERIVPDYIGKCITDLPKDHYAREYVMKRQIPEDKLHLLYFTEDFSKIAEKFFKTSFREPRLVIPFFDDKDRVVGVQGRSFEVNAKIRYITYKSPHIERLWYGLNSINALKPVYVVEGPIDSLFVSNAIAMVGSSYPDPLPTKIENSKLIFVFDNEPRNIVLHHMMERAINEGHKIVIWPSIPEKDINEICLKYGTEKMKQMLDSNTYSTNAARLKFGAWKRS